MRLLVCGGRNYSDEAAVYSVLDAVHAKYGISAVVAGGASGADESAAKWARAAGVDLIQFPADWDAHGRAAGPIRNQRMLTEGKPDVVVAFPGGRGTADMKRKASDAGVKVWEPVR